MNPALRWTPEQLAVLTEHQAELLVSAAAGSGKTAVLVERVVRAALGTDSAEAYPLEQLVAVTFTRAAAAELRARVHQALADRLSAAHTAGAATGLLRDQLEALPRAGIDTIHGLCGQILRRFGHLRGLSAARQLDEQEASLILHDLVTALIDHRLGVPGDLLREAALAWGGSEGVGPADATQRGKGLRRMLLALHSFIRGLVDAPAWYAAHLEHDVDATQCDPAQPLLQELNAELLEWRATALAADAQLARQLGADYPEAQLLTLLRRRQDILCRLDLALGWNQLGALLAELHQKQADIPYKPTLLQAYRRDLTEDPAWYERLDGAFNELSAEVVQWRELFATPWALVAARENTVRGWLRTLWRTALELEVQYAGYKQARGLRDFADLERGAFDVLSAGPAPGTGTAVRYLPSEAALALRAQYRLVLVDEYQDTSPLQDAILELITPEPLGAGRPRLSVGDVKQSIYAFRQAEPGLFADARARLGAMPRALGQELKLQGNFRSRRAILDGVNYLFDGLMTQQLGGEDYPANRLEALQDYALLYEQLGAAAQPDPPVRLHLLPTGDASPAADADAAPASDGEDPAADDAGTADAQCRFVAARIAAIVAEGAPVYDTAAKTVRSVQWQDIAVLLRTAHGRVESLKAALEEAGVPYYAPGRSGFYERPEVADALSLLRVVDNPRQDIPLAAVLRGPALRLELAGLLSVARCFAGTPAPALWERVQRYVEAGDDPALRASLAAFLEQLRGWRDAVRREPLAEVLWRIYRETGLLIAAAAQTNGAQRLANLHRLLGLAQEFGSFDRQGVARFLEFIHGSRQAAGDSGEAPLAGEGQNAVRVMTVHQAKGLEFPVVIVPDLEHRFNRLELNSDVMWHRHAGLGGRYYNWPQRASSGTLEPPQRFDTLGWRAVRRRKARDLAAEELRLLYVAMTRARERLELVAAVKPDWQEKLSRVAAPPAALCRLDWLAWRFAAELGRLAVGPPQLAGPDACWELHLQPLTGAATVPALAAAQPAQPSGADPQRLIAQLAWRYPYAGSVSLPAKLTVTRLVQHGQLAREADATATAFDAVEAPAGAPAPRPGFMSAEIALSAAEIGTATHRVLAQVDYARHNSSAAVGALCGELAGQGLLDPAATRQVDYRAIAQAVAQLHSLLSGPGVQFQRELPVALLVPAAEAAQALGRPAEGLAAQDVVYVQGVIDLLVIDTGRALVLDFKTDHAAADELLARYTPQLLWYARAVRELLPQLQVSWALYGLSGAGLIGPFPA